MGCPLPPPKISPLCFPPIDPPPVRRALFSITSLCWSNPSRTLNLYCGVSFLFFVPPFGTFQTVGSFANTDHLLSVARPFFHMLVSFHLPSALESLPLYPPAIPKYLLRFGPALLSPFHRTSCFASFSSQILHRLRRTGFTTAASAVAVSLHLLFPPFYLEGGFTLMVPFCAAASLQRHVHASFLLVFRGLASLFGLSLLAFLVAGLPC